MRLTKNVDMCMGGQDTRVYDIGIKIRKDALVRRNVVYITDSSTAMSCVHKLYEKPE